MFQLYDQISRRGRFCSRRGRFCSRRGRFCSRLEPSPVRIHLWVCDGPVHLIQIRYGVIEIFNSRSFIIHYI